MTWPPTYVQRCKRQRDQCNRDGQSSTECVKVEDRHAWRCPRCGREYSALEAWQYREEVGDRP